jgi:hypothetical protein
MAGNAWETMEQGARWALEHARELSPSSPVEGMGPLLRLWTYPLQGTYSSWTILVPTGSEELDRPFVREVVWKRRQDERHLASANRKHKLRTKLESTIHVRDAEVSSGDLDPFLKAGARLFVPAISLEEPLPEGDVSGFEGYRSLAYLRMEWHGPGPVEWAATVAWIARLRGLLVASLQEREKAGG